MTDASIYRTITIQPGAYVNITADQYEIIYKALFTVAAQAKVSNAKSPVLDSVVNAVYVMCTRGFELEMAKYVVAKFYDQLTEYHPDVATAVDQTINLIHKDVYFPFDVSCVYSKTCTVACRDGTPAKFIAYSTTAKGKSVVAEVDGELYSYYIDGTYSSDGPHNLDLFIRQTSENDTANK